MSSLFVGNLDRALFIPLVVSFVPFSLCPSLVYLLHAILRGDGKAQARWGWKRAYIETAPRTCQGTIGVEARGRIYIRRKGKEEEEEELFDEKIVLFDVGCWCSTVGSFPSPQIFGSTFLPPPYLSHLFPFAYVFLFNIIFFFLPSPKFSERWDILQSLATECGRMFFPSTIFLDKAQILTIK